MLIGFLALVGCGGGLSEKERFFEQYDVDLSCQLRSYTKDTNFDGLTYNCVLAAREAVMDGALSVATARDSVKTFAIEVSAYCRRCERQALRAARTLEKFSP